MKLTRPFKETVAEMVREDPEFAKALFYEAGMLLLNGDSSTARLALRDLVNGTMGFEKLARKTGKPSKSLHRMLSIRGNPSMDNLTLVLNALRNHLLVEFGSQNVELGKPTARRRRGAA